MKMTILGSKNFTISITVNNELRIEKVDEEEALYVDATDVEKLDELIDLLKKAKAEML